jgi:hypothetical protein
MAHEFQNTVRGWIGEALATSVEVSFNDLVCALPGVHPNDVAQGLDQLRVKVLRETRRKGECTGRKPLWRLPVPHPLDYDWRFTCESRSLLLGKLNEIVSSEGRVVFLGAPTLFRDAQDEPLGCRSFLIDACPEVVSALPAAHANQVFVADLLQNEIPVLSAKAVVADPPWYEEFATAFLWASSRIAELGGTVFLSTPPDGTRPGIKREWSRTVAFASDLGLILRSTEQCLRYYSPPFERNALQAAGHPDVQSEWRPGVLARFDKVRVSNVARSTRVSERDEWVERSILGVRFRMRRMAAPRTRNPLLLRLVDRDVLPSVSRRDPRRHQADVWTSGNRIFACSDTEALAWILEALESGHRPDTSVESLLGRQLGRNEKEFVIDTAEQVSRLVSCELEEYVLKWEG